MPAATSSSGRTPPSDRVRSGLAEISSAAYSTSASFAISDGWIWNGPAPSQRLAPLTSMPKPGHQHEDQAAERRQQQHRA